MLLTTTTQHPLMKTLIACALGALLGLSAPAQAELTLSGTPFERDSTEQNQNYTLLAAQLSQFLGETVRYVPPVNIQGYAQAIRQGEYDILIDGPHFSAWRVAQGLHQPVAQADTALTYVVVVPTADTRTRSLEQLISQPVCVSPPPQLSTLMFLNQYPNPLQEPVMHMMEGYLPKIEKLLKGECRAAVLSASFYEHKLDKVTQAGLRVIFNTRPLPGYVMTASPKLSETKRADLGKRLSTGNPAHDPLLQALTKASVHNGEPEKLRWTAPNAEAIKGLDQLLIKQSYGW